MSGNLTIHALNDMHVHLRKGPMLATVDEYTDRCCAYALVMPNTGPPILTGEDLVAYRAELKKHLKVTEPLMTFQLTEQTTPKLVSELKKAGAVAAKLYPADVTTNSNNGVGSDMLLHPTEAFKRTLRALQRENLVLCLHGEMPGTFCMRREEAFLPVVMRLHDELPQLRIVLEHITTAAAWALVANDRSGKLAATITLHHLMTTLDDVVGDKLQPHNFCKPIPKSPIDRDCLKQAALSANPNFFFGSDSAPHPVDAKECAHGCAGVFTAPVMTELLVEFFTSNHAMDKLHGFTHLFGRQFYELPTRSFQIQLEPKPHRVPDVLGEDPNSVVPFHAGKQLNWKIIGSTT